MGQTVRGFLEEEVAIMSCYTSTHRQLLVTGMEEAIPHADKDIQQLMTGCIRKLANLTEAEYEQLRGHLEDPMVF